MKTFILISSLFFLVNQAYSSQVIGKIIIIKGNATQLRPGEKDARRVKRGDEILKDTSIVTSEKSFVKVKLSDNSIMTIGPSSKVVLDTVAGSKASFVSLLKGKLRSKVKKQKNPVKNKLYLQTRTAAMGVRGTEFQTHYNPENKVTNLLTFEGEVAMVKLSKQKKKAIFKGSKNINKDTQLKLKEVEIKQLDSILSSNDAAIVKQGQYSGTTQALEKTSLPVVINPTQLNVIYRNVDLSEKPKNLIGKSRFQYNTKKLKVIKPVAQEAPPEGFFNKKTGEYAPRSGGFLDLKTGLYIPPSNDSGMSSKTNTYRPSNVGKIDGQTGQYIPPKGLELDGQKGFVVVDEKKSKTSPILLARTQQMNDLIKKDIVVNEQEEKIEEKPLVIPELLADSMFEVRLHQGEQSIELESFSNFGIPRLETARSSGVGLTWLTLLKKKLHFIGSININSNKYKEFGGYPGDQSNSTSISLGAGVKYFWTHGFRPYAKIETKQHHYVQFQNKFQPNTSVNLTDIGTPQVKIGFDTRPLSYKKLSLIFDLAGYYANSKKKNGLKVDSTFGTEVKIGLNYYLSSSKWFKIFVFNDHRKMHIDESDFSAKQRIESNGIALTYGFHQ